MQLKLSFDLFEPISLPLGHHAILQGFIYHLLSESKDYADFLHDTGYMDGVHSFKLFVFSTLHGNHSIDQGRIVYRDQIHLEIRSPKTEFCNILMQALQSSHSLELGHKRIRLSECAFTIKAIDTDSIRIRMLSPLSLSTTYRENERKKTRYISPTDSEFANALQQNTTSKYRATYNKEPISPVTLDILSLTEDDRYVTKFNNHIFITGWNGLYQLSGDPSLLTFLYDSGLGSRNSQGFGMFEPI